MMGNGVREGAAAAPGPTGSDRDCRGWAQAQGAPPPTCAPARSVRRVPVTAPLRTERRDREFTVSQYSPVQPNTPQGLPVPPSSVQCHPAQPSPVHPSTTQYNPVEPTQLRESPVPSPNTIPVLAMPAQSRSRARDPRPEPRDPRPELTGWVWVGAIPARGPPGAPGAAWGWGSLCRDPQRGMEVAMGHPKDPLPPFQSPSGSPRTRSSCLELGFPLEIPHRGGWRWHMGSSPTLPALFGMEEPLCGTRWVPGVSVCCSAGSVTRESCPWVAAGAPGGPT